VKKKAALPKFGKIKVGPAPDAVIERLQGDVAQANAVLEAHGMPAIEFKDLVEDCKLETRQIGSTASDTDSEEDHTALPDACQINILPPASAQQSCSDSAALLTEALMLEAEAESLPAEAASGDPLQVSQLHPQTPTVALIEGSKLLERGVLEENPQQTDGARQSDNLCSVPVEIKSLT